MAGRGGGVRTFAHAQNRLEIGASSVWDLSEHDLAVPAQMFGGTCVLAVVIHGVPARKTSSSKRYRDKKLYLGEADSAVLQTRPMPLVEVPHAP
eukprot:1868038-Rhodomonas_salina.2